jgi:antitoxin component YwqK of YwqJK toxin-antitoxin module
MGASTIDDIKQILISSRINDEALTPQPLSDSQVNSEELSRANGG